MRGLLFLKDRVPSTFKYFIKPLKPLGKIFLLVLILPTYKYFLAAKKITTKFYAPQVIRNRIIHPFSRRYLIHLVFIAVFIITLFVNLSETEARRQDFKQDSIMAQLVTTEDLSDIAQEGPISEARRVNRYLGETSVENKLRVSELVEPEDILPSTVMGSAVVKPLLSPIEEGMRQRDEIIYYAVQTGDMISSIAEQFSVSVNTILWENNLSAYSLIRPGDKLAILPGTGIRHKVAKGETLEKIAKTYSVTVEKIIEANKLASSNDINIGEKLVIPGGKKPYVAPSIQRQTVAYRGGGTATGSGKMLWPSSCRRITQYYGWRHTAVDVACGKGKAIYAADGGRVIKARGGYNGGYGLIIIIDHGNGIQTLYGHLSNIYLQVGDEVAKGQLIAAEGSTGRSTGPHLHFEVRVGGGRKNPLSYIK